MSDFADEVFSIKNHVEFEKAALELFQYQAANVKVYAEFLEALSINPTSIKQLEEIPFLPIEFFKTHTIISKEKTPETTFTSSGTTGTISSKHLVADVDIYERSFSECFKIFYDEPGKYCILALLPSYLEREGSSLVYMANDLIRKSNHPLSGFYLNNYEEISVKLKLLRDQHQPTILLGVTYALLDLAEKFPVNFPELIIMETGGMKGKRKEMVREELHAVLQNAFGVKNIHSEYGMTELLSQAYSNGNGIYQTPPWMKLLIRDVNDPKNYLPPNATGGINVIDLANIYSCAFIATQDLGKLNKDGTFEVLGRFDNSDLRGCNLMVE